MDDRTKRTVKKEKWMLPATLALVLAVAAVLYRRFLMGQANFLYTVSDGFSQYLPIYRELIRRLTQGDFSLWSMSVGLGAPATYTLLFYPLNLLPVMIGAFWGEGAMSVGFAWMQVVKILLTALFAWRFLRKLALRPEVCSVMSLACAFCGTIILRGNWRFPADEWMLTMLLLWSVECYLQDKKWYGIPVSVMLLGCVAGVHGIYLFALLTFLYATARFILKEQSAKDFIPYIGRGMGWYLLGALMCAIVVIGFNWTMFAAARYGDTRSYFGGGLELTKPSVLTFGLMSALNVNISGTFDCYIGPLNYLERPIFFCGVGSLFLGIQAFALGEKRIRRIMAAILCLICAYMVFPVVQDVFNALIQNEELAQRSFRLSDLWVTTSFILGGAYGAQCVLSSWKVNIRLAVLTGGVLLAALGGYSILSVRLHTELNRGAFLFALIVVIAWMVLLCLYGLRGAEGSRRQTVWLAAAALLMLADLIGNAGPLIERSALAAGVSYDDIRVSEMGYYSGVDGALDRIRQEDDGWYRVYCDRRIDSATYCYPQYFGFFDSSYYCNINKETYDFLCAVAPGSFANGIGTKYSVGVGRDPVLSALLGYRYAVYAEDTEAPEGYRLLDTVGNFRIYRNETPLSIGMVFSSYMTSSEFERLDEEQRRMILLHSLVVEDEDATSGPFLTAEDAERLLADMELAELIRERQKDQLEITDWSEDRISGRVTASDQGDQTLLLSIPRVYGWQARVDGQRAETIMVDAGLLAIPLMPGSHTIELVYRPVTLWIGIGLSAAAAAVYAALALTERRRRRDMCA